MSKEEKGHCGFQGARALLDYAGHKAEPGTSSFSWGVAPAREKIWWGVRGLVGK